MPLDIAERVKREGLVRMMRMGDHSRDECRRFGEASLDRLAQRYGLDIAEATITDELSGDILTIRARWNAAAT